MLSKANKQLVIDYIIENLNEDTIESRDNIKNPFYIFKYAWYPELFLNTMYNWLKNNYTFEDNDFNEVLKIREMYNSPLYKIIDNTVKNRSGYVLSIIDVLKNTDIELFRFTYNQTDFTPCHNILVTLSFDYFNDFYKKYEKRDFNIQIRKNDFPFNEGSCYGRNTHMVKTFELTDDNIDKCSRKIGIKYN